MATKIISLFNHKGGVSKTTTAFHLGWVLAESGKRVLLIDTDPQCNLTGLALSFSDLADFEDFYLGSPNANIYNALKPAFSGAPEKLGPAAPVNTACKNLFLLAGHIDISSFEPELSMASKLIEAMPVLQNLPGAFGFLIRRTAEHINADYVIIDMSPSIGALNQNILMQSDYFIVPTSPDYFCYMAINSLRRVLPSWYQTTNFLRALNPRLTYKVPDSPPVFLGFISQRFRPRKGKPALAFQKWIDSIYSIVCNEFVPELQKLGMTLSSEKYIETLGKSATCELAQISDFNSLIAISQDCGVPVFALTKKHFEEANQGGVVLENSITARDAFRKTYEMLGQNIMRLIT